MMTMTMLMPYDCDIDSIQCVNAIRCHVIPELASVGMPGPQTVLAAALCFLLCLLRPWPSRKALSPEPWAVRAVLCGYFAALALLGHAFSPEKQVSTGVHQQFGECEATDVDLLGYERKRYICRERYPETYFRLDCPQARGL